MADGAELARMIAASRVIDLSVTTGTDLPCSPPEGQPPAQFLLNTYTWPRGPFLEYVQVHDDHTGTHIDAPAHFTPAPATGLPHATEHGGVTIEQLPLEQLMGPAAVVDVRHLIDAAPAGETTNLRESPVITAELLRVWEDAHGAEDVPLVVELRDGGPLSEIISDGGSGDLRRRGRSGVGRLAG